MLPPDAAARAEAADSARADVRRLSENQLTYICTNCQMTELELPRVVTAISDGVYLVVRYTCECSGDDELAGRYFLDPNRMAKLWGSRLIRLPWVNMEHGPMKEWREELSTVETVDDMFPPA